MITTVAWPSLLLFSEWSSSKFLCRNCIVRGLVWCIGVRLHCSDIVVLLDFGSINPLYTKHNSIGTQLSIHSQFRPTFSPIQKRLAIFVRSRIFVEPIMFTAAILCGERSLRFILLLFRGRARCTECDGHDRLSFTNIAHKAHTIRSIFSARSSE